MNHVTNESACAAAIFGNVSLSREPVAFKRFISYFPFVMLAQVRAMYTGLAVL